MWCRAMCGFTTSQEWLVYPTASIGALAGAPGPDYRKLHLDVTALIAAGPIDDGDGLRVEYDDTELKMAL